MDVHVTGRRILAIIVDGIIVGLPTGLMAALLGAFSSGGGGVSGSLEGAVGLFVALTSVVLYLGYYVLMEGYLGQTVGKMLLGIKVIREDDGAVPGRQGRRHKDRAAHRRWPVLLPGRLYSGAGFGKEPAPRRHGRPHPGGA
jgi:uncharacterized RDD family membrane protein YckC